MIYQDAIAASPIRQAERHESGWTYRAFGGGTTYFEADTGSRTFELKDKGLVRLLDAVDWVPVER